VPDRPLADSLRELYRRVPMGIRLGLGPLSEACARLDHPERAFAVVHVAGTNGKGSVCAMVDAIARAHGLRTGLYTSPHLSRFAERIRVDAEPLDDATLAPMLADTLARFPELTFFEVATLAAFRAFREAKVELAVLEVGLGGRLDATNVVKAPRAAAITRIAFDHMDRLGTTLEAIAREKAGIAKPGLDLALGPLSESVRAAIDDVAHAAGATTSSVLDDGEAMSFVSSNGIGLAGAHQRANAAVAYVLGARIGATKEQRARAIAGVVWPGRLETIHTARGDVLLDAAHNLDGVESLVSHVASGGVPRPEMALVFGVLADKEWEKMIDHLAPCTPHRFYVKVTGRAAVDPSDLRARHEGEAASGVEEAIEAARRAVGSSGVVVVCGSILLVGEARSILLGTPRDPPVAL
jgi:dihydrofolate synthase / folylpolyglutamate synthase